MHGGGDEGRARRNRLIGTVTLAAVAVLAAAGMAQAQPKGTVTRCSWTSKIYPGTVRDYWVYVPAQYRADKPAAGMVFQDGQWMVAEDHSWHLPALFDRLIDEGAMPVTIGIFVNPGVLPGPDGSATAPLRRNRSREYDDISDTYAQFLIEELIPEVRKRYSLSRDPSDWGIGGLSSGGICAFNAAWHRPDAFRRVLSFIGSFTDLRGGGIYPTLVRKYEPKPLRVFLEDAQNDLNNFAGNWALANWQMASALEYAGYDFRFVTTPGKHSIDHGASVAAEALTWLWRDWPQPIAVNPHPAGNAERHFAREIVDPASTWELVSQGHQFTEGPAIDAAGNVYFSDIPANRVVRVAASDAKVTVFREDTGEANGLAFGPDGRLYACQDGRRRIVAWSADGSSETVIADGVNSNDIVVGAHGDVWFTDPPGKNVWHVDPKGNKRVVFHGEGEFFPNGIALTPDQTLLAVNNTLGRWVASFRVAPDGSLADLEPLYRLEIDDDSSVTGADGMKMDSEGYLYVATKLGIQVCDPAGRVVAILDTPRTGRASNLLFAGPNLEWLYVTERDKVWRRHLRRHGVLPWRIEKPQAAR